MAADLDEQVGTFRSRPLDAGAYTFLAFDALAVTVPEGGRVLNIAVMVATGVAPTGTARSWASTSRPPRTGPGG